MRRIRVLIWLAAALFVVSLGTTVYRSEAQSAAMCGDIIEGEVSVQEANAGHTYVLSVNAGDEVTITASPFGESPNVILALFDPANVRIEYENNTIRGDETIANFVMPATGAYQIRLTTSGDNPFAYVLSIGCTLRDGTVVEPGDTLDPNPGPGATPTDAPGFAGYGFPGVAPVDFSTGVEIPLARSQAMTAPVGGDLVTLYTYAAAAGETATLRLSRVSGEISVGVAVINKDTNAVIFLGGMPFSNNLSVELSFPADGTYAIGLFRLDTAERSGTSGAVQITLE